MANEYADLAELKDMRNIDAGDTRFDGRLQKAITRASRAIDRRCGRRFYRDGIVSVRRYAPYGRTIYRGGQETLLVDDIATETGLLVSIGGISSDSFSVSPYREGDAITGLSLPSWYGGGIEVTAEWGWPQVPDSIEEATLLLANRRYMRKDSPEGVSGWSQEGQVQVSRFDPDIEDLVTPFVIEGFGS